MRIKPSDLKTVFVEVQKVRDFLNGYCGGPDKIPVSLDDITAAIEKVYGYKITTRLVPFQSNLIRGMIEIYENTATITVDSDLNTVQTRYVFMKEASHVMVQTADNLTNDPGDIIDYYIHVRPEDDDNGAHPPAVICEEITKYCAVELLFPPALRADFKAEIAAKKETLFTISERLHLPENLVEFTLSDWYMDLSERLRGTSPDRERFMPPQKKK